MEIEGKEKQDFYNSWIKHGHEVSSSAYRLLKTSYYGLDHFGVLIPSSKPSRGLLIYSQGHGGNTFDFKYSDQLIKLAKQKNFDLLIISMTNLGFNDTGRISLIPGRSGLIPIESQTVHGGFSLFSDSNNPQLTGVSLMITGNYEIVEAVRKMGHYKKIVMTGVSGGGWTTTLYAALNPAIQDSISFAGSVPLAFRGYLKNMGDYEQKSDLIYQDYDYWDFYALSVLDSDGMPTRSHYEIYNDQDPCCFDGKTAEKLIEIYNKTSKQKNLKFGIVANIRHEPNIEIISRVMDGKKISNFILQSD